MKTFIFDRIQFGYWGRTVTKQIKVRALTAAEAEAKACQRKDFMKTLRNGDRITYQLNHEA